jgi:hypothetical protein
VIGDLLMGATSYLDPATGDARVRFSGEGEAHLWFPRYELVTHLVLKSELRRALIHFYQGFIDDHTYLCEPVPENEMFVQRAAPHDRRAGGAPTSIIADFVK